MKNTEDTENTEAIENTEDTENAEAIENTEDTENAEAIENTEDTENAEAIENIEDVENIEDIDDAEALADSESEKEEMQLHKIEFPIKEILQEVRNIIFMEAEAKDIRFNIWVDPTIPCRIMGDLKKINYVLMHLLLKSIRYIEEGGVTLFITQYRKEDVHCLRYEVKSVGKGITSEIMEMDSGLTVCHKYIRTMGSELFGENIAKMESHFWFDMEMESVSKECCAKVKNPQKLKLLLVIKKKETAAFIRDVCNALNVYDVVYLTENLVVKEEFFTHILIDLDHIEAEQWIEKELPYRCEKLLLIHVGKQYKGRLKDVSYIACRPVTVFMIAELLNHWSEENKYKEEIRETLFQTRNVKALIVDDNEVNRMVAKNILTQYGMQIDDVESGTLAAQLYYNNEYDIVFMDYYMPGMDGIEATRTICNLSKDGKDAVIIALSANITEEIHNLFMEAGAKDLLVKPLDIRKVSRTLRKWLPKEKILENVDEREHASEMQKEMKRSILKEALCQVKELEWEKALMRMNENPENYIKVLECAYKNIEEQISFIKETEDLSNKSKLGRNFHSLKGIFINIGAQKLWEESQLFEEEIKQNNLDYFMKYRMIYIQETEQFLNDVKDGLSLYAEKSPSSVTEVINPVMMNQKYNEKLAQLKELVKGFEFNESTELMEELIQVSQSENREYLEKALKWIRNFCYEEAGLVLEKIELNL